MRHHDKCLLQFALQVLIILFAMLMTSQSRAQSVAATNVGATEAAKQSEPASASTTPEPSSTGSTTADSTGTTESGVCKSAQWDWHFEIAPFLWAFTSNGSVLIEGVHVNVDQHWDDIFHRPHFGAILLVYARRDQWGIFADGLYAVIRNPVRNGILRGNQKNRYGVLSAGLSYEAYKFCFGYYCFDKDSGSLSFEPYIGLRYTFNNAAIAMHAPGFGFTVSDNQNWTDPFFGLRIRYVLNAKWFGQISGDIGGTNAKTHYSYNVWGLLGYRPNTITTIYFGYRYFGQHFETGSGPTFTDWTMHMIGPMLGVSVTI